MQQSTLHEDNKCKHLPEKNKQYNKESAPRKRRKQRKKEIKRPATPQERKYPAPHPQKKAPPPSSAIPTQQPIEDREGSSQRRKAREGSR